MTDEQRVESGACCPYRKDVFVCPQLTASEGEIETLQQVINIWEEEAETWDEELEKLRQELENLRWKANNHREQRDIFIEQIASLEGVAKELNQAISDAIDDLTEITTSGADEYEGLTLEGVIARLSARHEREWPKE